ncbi:MAG: thioredoxin [Actinomycetota bacterium]|nr:thioredoxin [Actinomycetota bacterium]
MGADIIEVSENSFNAEVARSNKPVFVDFWAPWCGPCNFVAPIMAELANLYSSKIKFAKVNVDDNQRLAGEYQIRSIPTFILFENGEVKKRIIGIITKEKFVTELSDWLG